MRWDLAAKRIVSDGGWSIQADPIRGTRQRLSRATSSTSERRAATICRAVISVATGRPICHRRTRCGATEPDVIVASWPY